MTTAKSVHLDNIPDGDNEADHSRPSKRSTQPLANERVDNDGDSQKHAEATTNHSTQVMTPDQLNAYKSLRRRELIDLHLTLSRRRELLIIQMTNVSNVILELAEDYHELKSTSCVPCYLCQLDHLIEEALAAYDRRQHDGDDQKVKSWSLLISQEASGKRRKRPTVLAEQPKRRSADLYAIPIAKLRHEVADLEADIAVYQKRIVLDNRKMNLMGHRWAQDKQRLCCFRYFHLKQIIESAITDYRVDYS